MKLRKTHLLPAIVVACLSCGSGDGGGVTGTGLVIGPIEGFGSIVVNGIELDMGSAVVRIDGMSADESDLHRGMIVEVLGELDLDSNTGSASLVRADAEVRGPVDAAADPEGTLVVLGQVVLTDQDTVFENTALASLAVNDVVEVNGFPDAEGNVRATRVAEIDGEYVLEADGVVTDLDQAGKTFRLGAQIVDFSEADIDGAPDGGLTDGLFVEVESASDRIDIVLFADEVNVKTPGYEPDEVIDVVVHGTVSEIRSADEFLLNGTRPVRITPQTMFEGGNAADIELNAEVRVTGILEDANDVLTATLVRF